MCGIAGRVNFLSGAPVNVALIRGMCGLLAHRGRDEEGAYIDGPVGLGHRRLAIIDLSPAAHQPMGNDSSTAWIVFNGEIFNFRELRLGLEAAGHRFRSQREELAWPYGEKRVDYHTRK